ncbi:unnamed protein product, partial [Rotaria magnacalcarata]
TPYAKNVTDNNVTLGWADAARGTEKVRKYKVMYRKVGENENETEEKWTEVYTNSNQKELIISNLPSETTFVFKVQSITAIGLSLISDISEPMETLTKKEPRTPLALKQTSSDVDVLHTKNAQITFEIDGLPRPNITWLFNGNPIQPSAKYQMEARYQIILNVNKTDFVDSGTYTAVIEYGIEKLKVPVKMTVKGTSMSPMRGTEASLSPQAQWSPTGITVAGGHGQGGALNQLNAPCGLFVDKDGTVYIADYFNNRVVAWPSGATSGQVVAGGNGAGNGLNQLYFPTDMVADRRTDSLLICDRINRRVVRWPHRNGTHGEIVLSNIDCWGLTIDYYGFLYVSDFRKEEVQRYKVGDPKGTVVAGGNGQGDRLDQLHWPSFLFVTQDQSVYVGDSSNNRVVKWTKGAQTAELVAGGNGKGSAMNQVNNACGVVVDRMSTVYVAEFENPRVMRWPQESSVGDVVAGGNGEGYGANQLSHSYGLSFDRNGDLYVTDHTNFRVQKFELISS